MLSIHKPDTQIPNSQMNENSAAKTTRRNIKILEQNRTKKKKRRDLNNVKELNQSQTQKWRHPISYYYQLLALVPVICEEHVVEKLGVDALLGQPHKEERTFKR